MRGPKTTTTNRARLLRKQDNDAECVLWEALRGRRLNGYKFVRQFPIGPYFADFACRKNKLVVEVDGSQHANSEYDERRDAFMNDNDWSVVRFWAHEVISIRVSVLETILAVLEGRYNEDVDAADLKLRLAKRGSDGA